MPYAPEVKLNTKSRTWLGVAVALALLILPAQAMAGSGGVDVTGSDAPAGARAKLVDDLAVAPAGAPPQVVRAIEAANSIIDKPYRYGGGHQRWHDRATTAPAPPATRSASTARGCSRARCPPETSSAGASAGKGEWITTYSNAGHMYVGDRRATARHLHDRRQRPRLERASRRVANGPFKVRHPLGL